MDFATKTKFVDALLKCPAMRDRNTRNAIVDKLPEVRGRITRSEIDRTDVANIMDRSLDFDGEFVQLIEVVRFYEGNSKHIQRIDALWNKHEVSASTLSDGNDRVDMERVKSRVTTFIYSTLICCTLLNLVILCFVIYRGQLVNIPEPKNPTITMIPLEDKYDLMVEIFLGDNISKIECDEKIFKVIRSQFEELKNVDIHTNCNNQLDGNERNKRGQPLIFYKAEIRIWTERFNYDMEVSIDSDGYKTKPLDPEPDNDNKVISDRLIFMALVGLSQSEHDRAEYSNAIELFELATKRRPERIVSALDEIYCKLGGILSKINKTDKMIDDFEKFCSK